MTHQRLFRIEDRHPLNNKRIVYLWVSQWSLPQTPTRGREVEDRFVLQLAGRAVRSNIPDDEPLEHQFQSKLSNARLLSRFKGSKIGLRAQLQEVAGSGNCPLIKVDSIEDVEELGTELQTHTFGEFEGLSESHVPIVVTRIT